MNFRSLENYKVPAEAKAPDGACEFAGELLFAAALGRKCGADDLSCFGFGDADVYASCPTRRKRRREV